MMIKKLREFDKLTTDIFDKVSLFIKTLYYKTLTEEKLTEIEIKKQNQINDIRECQEITISEIVEDYAQELRQNGWDEEDIIETIKDCLGVDYARKSS